MSLQVIKSIDGKDEYVLLPMIIYKALYEQIETRMKKWEQLQEQNEYVPFEMTDYVDNPVALARIKARITQEELAKRLNVSQAYISKVESQSRVSTKLLTCVKEALGNEKLRP